MKGGFFSLVNRSKTWQTAILVKGKFKDYNLLITLKSFSEAGGDSSVTCSLTGSVELTSRMMPRLSYLPTKLSRTELFPALCSPTTAICGSWRLQLSPALLRASCRLLTSGISSSIPRLPIAASPPEPLPWVDPSFTSSPSCQGIVLP